MQQAILVSILKEEKLFSKAIIFRYAQKQSLALFLETRKKMKQKQEKRDATPLKTRKKVTNKFLILCLEMKCQIFGKEKAIPFSKMHELFPKKLQELRSS